MSRVMTNVLILFADGVYFSRRRCVLIWKGLDLEDFQGSVFRPEFVDTGLEVIKGVSYGSGYLAFRPCISSKTG